MSIDLRKQPPRPHAYNSKYGIGDIVWHTRSAYRITMCNRILSVRFQYNPYGELISWYCFNEAPSDWWIEESELFQTEQEAENSL